MRAVVSDAYGTLFDVHSVVLRDGHNITGDVRTLSTLWRQRQLEIHVVAIPHGTL